MADYKEQMLALQKPLQPDRVVWRVQQSGFSKQGKPWAMVLAYMDNRAVQERFDEVFGIAGWKNEFKTAPDGGTLCGISVKFGDEWVTKWDGAENTQVEAVKGGLSGSMKRAAVQWGVGRYLYDLPTSFAQTSLEKTDGWNKVFDKNSKKNFWWKNPQLPSWALPQNPKVQNTKADLIDDTKDSDTNENRTERENRAKKADAEAEREKQAKIAKLNDQYERALKAANDNEAPMVLLTKWNKLPKAAALKEIAEWINENTEKKS